MTTVSKDAIASLLRADHGDPFSLLGIHGDDGELVLRVFRPDAASVEVHEIGGAARSWRAEKVSPDGFFEAALEDAVARFRYTLRFTGHKRSLLLRAADG
jgi:1,4-alpha-glucan branching enzyme